MSGPDLGLAAIAAACFGAAVAWVVGLLAFSGSVERTYSPKLEEIAAIRYKQFLEDLRAFPQSPDLEPSRQQLAILARKGTSAEHESTVLKELNESATRAAGLGFVGVVFFGFAFLLMSYGTFSGWSFTGVVIVAAACSSVALYSMLGFFNTRAAVLTQRRELGLT